MRRMKMNPIFTIKEDLPISKRYKGNRPNNRKPIEYTINENGCWECYGRVPNSSGYHKFQRNKKQVKLHRYVYETFRGKIPEGLMLRHTCDNRTCLNPNHLIEGTNADNMRDKMERGRQARGETAGTAKLTERQVKRIKALLSRRKKQIEIAHLFNVSIMAISDIKRKRSWKHVA